MIFDLEKAVTVSVGVLALCAGSYLWGYSNGGGYERAKQNKAVVERVVKVQAKQAETSTEIKQAGETYETQYFNLMRDHERAMSELGRLRVKRPSCMPATATSASARNAASEESAVRPGAGEVNLDGIAGQVIELGKDLDDSNLRIEELKALVVAYQKACTVQ